MSEDSTISCYNSHSNAYDVYQSEVVPRYQDMLEMVAKTCSRYVSRDCGWKLENHRHSPRIIDLGCGTGNASLAILQKMPAKIFLADGSSSMIDIALGKISSAAEGAVAGYKVVDLNEDSWAEGIGPGEYDAIVSTLVLEHLSFDCYRSAIRKCHDLLRPGGWLIAVEGYEEEGSDMLQWFNEEMKARRENLDPELSSFVAKLRNEKEIHYYCSKAQKADWWKKAGFCQVNVLWQYLCIALMVGRKPGRCI